VLTVATEQVVRVTVKVTVEMAHEQVLKLRCEYHGHRAWMFHWLRRGDFGGAYMAAIGALKTKAQLRRIARWV
jgi:hypothetical protein